MEQLKEESSGLRGVLISGAAVIGGLAVQRWARKQGSGPINSSFVGACAAIGIPKLIEHCTGNIEPTRERPTLSLVPDLEQAE
jgi:hypothetical protein